MAKETTYLELSEARASGSSHKFYEVIVEDTQVSIRYGRIGDAGQTQTKTYPTPDKAKAEAAKKINEKLKKGYEPAVKSVLSPAAKLPVPLLQPKKPQFCGNLLLIQPLLGFLLMLIVAG
jgi:predicted DNA-binding WGR domain protein